MKNEKKEISWGIIIVCLIFIWPVGIVLLLMRLFQQENGQNTLNNLNNSIKKLNTGNFFKSYPPISLKCDNCGAYNTIKKDEITKCIYCSTPQSYPKN